jgi:hypothetical protein
MTVNFLNRGVLSLEFLIAFTGTVNPTEGNIFECKREFLLLEEWSVGAFLLAAFPTDVSSTPVSWHGAIHLVVAVVAFLGGAFGALLVSLGMNGGQVLQQARRFALPIGALAVVLCLVWLLAPFLAPHLASQFGGLIERIFLGTVLLWTSAISAYMLGDTHKSAGQTKSPSAVP